MGLLQLFNLIALALALSGAIKTIWKELKDTTSERDISIWQVIATAFSRSLFFLILSFILASIFLWERWEDDRLFSQQSARVLEALIAPATLQLLVDETDLPRARLLEILQSLEAQGKIVGQRETITLGKGKIVPVKLYQSH